MSVYASIIIPTKNAGDRFNLVLKHIFKSRVNFEYEVIVVDSGSTDKTKEIITMYPIRLIKIKPLSFSHGGSRNIGAEAAKGEILVYLSQDAIPMDENWLTNLINGFANKEIAGIFGRQVPDKDASVLEKFFLEYVYPDYKIIKDYINPADCTLQEILFSDVNSAIRKSGWEDNKFREDLIMSEDQAWAKDMLMKKKKIVYEPKAAVYHSHNYTIRRVILRNFDSGLSLEGIVNAPLKRSFLYEAKYIKSAMLYFFRSKSYRYLCIFPFYETFRLLGFFLGKCSQFLPIWVKRMLSENKAYWQQINRIDVTS